MSDELRAAEALAALRQIAEDQIEYKTNIDAPALSVDGREVTHLFSVDCLDLGNDITPVSAFTKSVKERPERIPHLFMHDVQNASIARIINFQALDRDALPDDVKTEHPDATGGMACVSRYLTTARADEVFQGIKDGIPYQCSFGYRVLQKGSRTLPDGRSARVLTEVKLLEVSTVLPNHAMQPATRTRLGKAVMLLDGMKAGRRHNRTDIDLLREIARLAYELGADNIEMILEQVAEAESAAPSEKQTRTLEADRILASVATILGR